MPRTEINGISIVYELIGDGDKAITITPGGRFSRNTPGVRPLAEKLAEAGYKVLIWDRPNCGESALSFDAECESFQNADTLAGLIKELGLAPALIYGASGGSREALLVAIRHPELVKGVFCQWLSGGNIGLATLPMAYNATPAIVGLSHGMEAVAAMPEFATQIENNPSSRDMLLSYDPFDFLERMQQWAGSFFAKPGQPIPCVNDGDLEGIKAPVVILRSGVSDPHHTRATSEAVAAAIPGADLQEPPWGDREWLERMEANGKDQSGLFKSMPMLAPQILEFAGKIGHV